MVVGFEVVYVGYYGVYQNQVGYYFFCDVEGLFVFQGDQGGEFGLVQGVVDYVQGIWRVVYYQNYVFMD